MAQSNSIYLQSKKNLGEPLWLRHDVPVFIAQPDLIKDSLRFTAAALGFSDCRVARAGRAVYGDALCLWLEKGWHAGMTWMARSVERRLDTEQVLPGCRSVICLSYDYDSPSVRAANQGSICLYAHGRDYHGILEEKLADLSELLAIYGGDQKCYVDAGPVPERDYAEACGLGWRGKSGLILRKKGGSRFFIAVILTTLDLVPDAPVSGMCGSCSRCVEMCPTGAIMQNGLVDANRCLSYWTIEHQGSIPDAIRPLIGDRLYGCDTCVTVCPWNRKALPHADERFHMSRALTAMSLKEILSLDQDGFALLFRHSPLKRLKRERLLRNGCIVMGNTGTPDDIAFLKRMENESSLVAEHARWAVDRIRCRCAEDTVSEGLEDEK